MKLSNRIRITSNKPKTAASKVLGDRFPVDLEISTEVAALGGYAADYTLYNMGTGARIKSTAVSIKALLANSEWEYI